VIAPTSTLTGEAAKRLNIDIMECQKNRMALLASRKEIQQKIAKIFEPREFEPRTDPDLMLYGGGFFGDGDKGVMNRIHNTAPEELGGQGFSFDDKRLPEMLFRYRARNYPETLNGDEQAQWLEHCRARLIEGESDNLTFEGFRAELEEARNMEGVGEEKLRVLDQVEAFGRELEDHLKG
jgi:exodeoxyribonuclease-1